MIPQASKLLIHNTSDTTFLVLYRADHPVFGDSIDLPGGTIERGETVLQGTIREVKEEAGITVLGGELEELYTGRSYARFGMRYSLYLHEVSEPPLVTLSWEHGAYEWASLETLVNLSRDSSDSFMHMVADVVEKRFTR